MSIVHISFGGPVRYLSANKVWMFEDHPYCGPIVLGKNGDPLDNQPPESSPFWRAVDRWYASGKPTFEVGRKTWCGAAQGAEP